MLYYLWGAFSVYGNTIASLAACDSHPCVQQNNVIFPPEASMSLLLHASLQWENGVTPICTCWDHSTQAAISIKKEGYLQVGVKGKILIVC
jgi:hypothetical protein